METKDLKRLVASGYSLVPLHGKDPFEENWQKSCIVRRPFHEKDFTGCNAGICTGPASGVIALDLDDLALFLPHAKANGYTLPVTREHTTGSGKIHKLYKYPSNGKKYGNRSFKKYGFDIRGVGGQIVAPGSIHPDTGQPYQVSMDVPLADAPEWLLKLASHDDEKEPFQDAPQSMINTLPVSSVVKDFLKYGADKGLRSEPFFKALCSLVGINLSEREIVALLEACPGGEKYRDKGNARHSWLRGEIKRARKYISEAEKPSSSGKKQSRLFSLGELDESFTKNVKFLWRRHIPEGMPIMLNGREGLGKTTIAVAVASEILSLYPDACVLWIASEGFIADTIHKMNTLGVDRKRFLIVGNADETFLFNFSLPSDLCQLDEIMASCERKIAAVVVDSIRGISPYDDSDSKIKTVMLRLNGIVCDKNGASLIYIDHMKKGLAATVLDQAVGTTAKTAAVRRVFSVLPVSGFVRKIVMAKSNIMGENPPELIAALSDGKLVIYESQETDDTSLIGQAEQWLIKKFSERDTYSATELYDAGKTLGFSPSTLKTAKGHLKIDSLNQGVGSAWLWHTKNFNAPI